MEPEKETMDRRFRVDVPTGIQVSSGNAEDPLSQNFRPEKQDLGVVPVEKLEVFYDEGSESDGDSSTWLLSQDMEQESESHSTVEADMKPEVVIFPESGDPVRTVPDQVKQEAEEMQEEEDDFDNSDADSDHDTDSEEEEDPEDDSSNESESSSSESDDDSSSILPRPCPQPNCKLTFTTKLLLKAHLTLHGDWQCEKCPLVKDFAPHLALHELQHAQKRTPSKKQKFFPCPRCPPTEKTWDSKLDYIQHFLKTHLSFGKQTKKHLCEICGAKMTISSKKSHHQFYHNTEGLGPSQIHRCPQCPAYFVKKSQVLRHRYLVHYKTQCPTCGKSWNRKAFWGHVKTCGRSKVRVKVQTEWKCPVEDCQQVFAAKRTLTRHQKTAHGALGKHPCDSCDKTFSSSTTLRLHHQTAHLGWRPFPCPLCEKTFQLKTVLTRHHEAVHLGLKPFPCDTCGRSFSTQEILKKHQLIHSGERPFECPVCQRRFRQSHSVKDHLNTHRNKETNMTT